MAPATDPPRAPAQHVLWSQRLSSWLLPTDLSARTRCRRSAPAPDEAGVGTALQEQLPLVRLHSGASSPAPDCLLGDIKSTSLSASHNLRNQQSRSGSLWTHDRCLQLLGRTCPQPRPHVDDRELVFDAGPCPGCATLGALGCPITYLLALLQPHFCAGDHQLVTNERPLRIIHLWDDQLCAWHPSFDEIVTLAYQRQTCSSKSLKLARGPASRPGLKAMRTTTPTSCR